MMQTSKIPFFYTSILYICGFFLFLEWLYPVQQITDTQNLSVFMVYAAFCFIISLVQLKWWLSFLLKGFGMLLIINHFFMSFTFLSKPWLQNFQAEMAFNLQALFQQSWYELTPLFRSFLFLLLIWLMSYLLYYWFVLMKRIFLFVLLTIVYVTVLDTFTVYDANGAIIRTFIISFIAFGVANFFKEIEHESIRYAWLKKTSVWVFPIIAVVLFSTLIGYATPKFDPQWPDPVPFLKSAAKEAGQSGGNGSGIHKVGYGEDDSHLGGSFIQDYTPVFQAATKEKHYWRIETKDVYTGKGWESSVEANYEKQNGRMPLETFDKSVETDRQETIVEFQGNTNIKKLVYPYGIRQVQAGSDAAFLLDQHSGEIRTQAGGKDVSLKNYTIQYDYPSFAIDALRKASTKDPRAIKEQYTQLPSSLPARVGELAEEITEASDNRYEKARAVEQYFGQNGYTYQTSNIPVPRGDQDYVDQFLFDSQEGYCDNYSTSMVVMLRTLGIPARWAKGFTSGEKIGEDIDGPNDTYDLYEVTSANAHSWVEVYFPGSGWVPFEPTQGFSNLTDFHINVEDADKEDQPVVAPLEEDKQKPEQEKKQEMEADEDTAASEAAGESNHFSIKWVYIGIGVAVLLLLAIVVYRLRFRLKTVILSMKWNHQSGANIYQEAYHHLLKLLKHNGLAIEPGQTLHEYAERVDNRYGTHEMGQLTAYYERMLYNDEVNQTEAKQLNELWKNLIKRIMA